MLAGYKARTEVLGISFIFLGSLWHFLLAKIKRHLEHTQGVNEALIGDGKRPFPNRVYQSIFPIFFLVYVDLLFIDNIFLAYQPFTFLKNLSGFAAFYFWLFFSFMLFTYQTVANGCMLRKRSLAAQQVIVSLSFVVVFL